MPQIKKLLIANRGEIALRIHRACHEMGIKTVAVHSTADADAMHVRLADEAICIGPPSAADSYLNIPNIISAAEISGADAIHPGYGFLSENAQFAEIVELHNILFVGPKPEHIRTMGDKVQAKRTAGALGLPLVPGSDGAISDIAEAKRIAEDIGYPVIIKAASGGGGRGMKVVNDADDLETQMQQAGSEAKAAFGDATVYMEKYLGNPRHIEFQIFGDGNGNAIHLGERDCSLQRRHQKVLEEAPSPIITAEERERMGGIVAKAMADMGYRGAGTIEFLWEAGEFYFIEMNTRLQVEHPVTEMITGLDLVEQMIRVAAGEPLSFAQADVKLDGWAVESRVYAEDPTRGFLPSTGRLTVYRPPAEGAAGGATIRNDTGVAEGGEISIYYDPMIAKLVTHAPTRRAAIEAQAHALDAFAIEGIRHNIPFLSALMAHERWRDGRLSTGFIAEEFPEGFTPAAPAGEGARVFAAAAAAIDHLLNERKRGISGQMRDGGALRFEHERVVWLGREAHPVTIEADPAGVAVAFPDGERLVVASGWMPGGPVWTGTIGGQVRVFQVRTLPNGVRLSHAGAACEARVYTRREAELAALLPEKVAAGAGKQLLCPMPGLVKAILVAAGQEVKAGEPLAMVEAMKMENVLLAERDATIATVLAKEGESLAVDAVIMEFA
jgi:propionyl-CoA carboxylase alpha chain